MSGRVVGKISIQATGPSAFRSSVSEAGCRLRRRPSPDSSTEIWSGSFFVSKNSSAMRTILSKFFSTSPLPALPESLDHAPAFLLLEAFLARRARLFRCDPLLHGPQGVLEKRYKFSHSELPVFPLAP